MTAKRLPDGQWEIDVDTQRSMHERAVDLAAHVTKTCPNVLVAEAVVIVSQLLIRYGARVLQRVGARRGDVVEIAGSAYDVSADESLRTVRSPEKGPPS